jgi:valyl-tRNA synthetase
LQTLVERVTGLFQNSEYAAAKSEIENFFWRDLADNYLEMAKQRLYDEQHPGHSAACRSLYQALLTVLKLFAPLFPYVTEEIYQGLFAASDGARSIHLSSWPIVNPDLLDPAAIETGERLVEIATAVRRYKSERSLPLGSELERLQLATNEEELAEQLRQAIPDLSSITRASLIEVLPGGDPGLTSNLNLDELSVAIG